MKEKGSKYNRIQAINVDTGEVVGNVVKTENEEVVLKTINPKKKEALDNKNDNAHEMSLFIEANEGSYFHLIYKYSYPIFVELQNNYEGTNANLHIMRFMILASYVTFGGKLFDNNGNEIKKSSLSKIWDVKNNRKSINETYNILKRCNYIYESEEGYLMINDKLIKKGAIQDFEKLKKQDKDLTYTRVFVDNLQDMYNGANKTQRKQLANLFKILPFINFKHNVFCLNPTEVDRKKLNILTWKELVEMCGYDKSQVARFKRDMYKLKINGHAVIGQFHTVDGELICVNPKVYYGGNNINDVQNLYNMFEMCANVGKNRQNIKNKLN